jgi:transcriptional regulator with XRE-family HTH domain
MQPIQMKMARAALGLSVEDLARGAGVDAGAVTALENGATVEGDALSALNIYFATHGIQLIDEDGVRARSSSAGDYVTVDKLTTVNDGGIS